MLIPGHFFTIISIIRTSRYLDTIWIILICISESIDIDSTGLILYPLIIVTGVVSFLYISNITITLTIQIIAALPHDTATN